MDAKHQVIFTNSMRKIFGHRDGKNLDGSSTKVKNLPASLHKNFTNEAYEEFPAIIDPRASISNLLENILIS